MANKSSKTTNGKQSNNYIKGRNARGRNNKPNTREMKDGDTSKELKDGENASDPKNDPEWYGAGSAMMRDAAGIIFSQVMGLPLRRSNLTTNYVGEDNQDERVLPGVMTLHVGPSVGTTVSTQSAMNIAFESMYSFVRHANSGSRNYDPWDLGIYTFGATQFYAFINWLVRIYGTANAYTMENRYYPKGLVAAQRVDFNDVLNNLAQFRYGISALSRKAAAFAVPNTLPIIKRHAFLYSGYFKEGESAKDNVYLFNPSYFWKFDILKTVPTTNPNYGSGMLRAVSPWQDLEQLDATAAENVGAKVVRNGTHTITLLKVQDLLDFGNELLDAFLEQEDLGIISGDILKAFGNEGIIKLAEIPIDFVIEPTFSEDALQQMRNSTFFGCHAKFMVDNTQTPDDYVDLIVPDVRQSKQASYVFSTPYMRGNIGTNAWSPQLCFYRTLSSPKAAPTTEDVVEMTRLNWGLTSHYDMTDVFGKAGYTFDDDVQIADSGTEIVTDVSIVKVWRGNMENMYVPPCLFLNRDTPLYNDWGWNWHNMISDLSEFEWHPEVMMMSNVGTTPLAPASIMNHMNYSIQHPDVIQRIHDTAKLFELNMPLVGLYYGTRK